MTEDNVVHQTFLYKFFSGAFLYSPKVFRKSRKEFQRHRNGFFKCIFQVFNFLHEKCTIRAQIFIKNHLALEKHSPLLCYLENLICDKVSKSVELDPPLL